MSHRATACRFLIFCLVSFQSVAQQSVAQHGYAQQSVAQQSPYKLKWNVELPVYVVGTTYGAVERLRPKSYPPLTSLQVVQLDPQSVGSFDRVATTLWNVPTQKASTYLTVGALGIPVLMQLDPAMRKHWKTNMVLYGEVLLLENLVKNITKDAILRTRPLAYNAVVPFKDKLELDTRNSFFSGHTSATAAATFFAAQMYADYHPDSPYKPAVWAVAAGIPAVVGYLRVAGGKHYPSDVIVGYVVGAGVGLLVPYIHKKLKKR